ncbi:hypothetical protein AB0F92_16635 [Kitasatospora aureofaciens]|uniref:hypothetical protein n=1 Tax=Kitasatospora aureofaciens TaxID=1894 RepID=UPI0034028A0A
MNNEQTAEWAATAIDTVLDQMDAGQKPNPADVLVANVALYAAERDGVPSENLQKHLRTR